MTQELVIGIGSAHVKQTRLTAPERVVGITTVFSADGNCLLSNQSREVDYVDYPAELWRSLESCINHVRDRNGWQPEDALRLIFHVFKPLRDASEAAVLRSGYAAARALRRRNQAPVTADEESFTAARHHAIRSMASTQVTATSTLEALAAAADAARACLHTLNIPGRQRHSDRKQKARPKFPHATATKITVTGKPQVTVFAPGFY